MRSAGGGLIVHVDDNEITRYTIARTLERGGYAVRSAGSGAELAVLLEQRVPDLVILDIRLPDVDGLELCRRLKADDRTALVPVLLLSATFSVVDRQVEGLSLGADAYLTHPAEPPVLLGTVDALLRARRAERAAVIEQAERRRLETERQLERARLEERERAALVLETVGDGIVLVDERGEIGFWNRAAERITGVASARAVGARLESVLVGLDPDGFRDGRGAHESPLVTLPVRVGDRNIWLSVNRSQGPEGVVYAFRDVSGEYRLESTRRDFVATVSHELRTPLTAVYGAARTLERHLAGETLDGTSNQLLRMIVEQAERLNQLIGDILTTTSLESETLVLQGSTVSLADLVEVARNAAVVRDENRHDVRVLVPQSTPHVWADRSRLLQVIENLIENALKYSPAGTPVEVAAEARTEAVVLTVADRGIGIPEEERDRIFDKFYRLDPNHVGGVAGSGLGLYVTRGLVEGMGGTIRVDGRRDGGSTFAVSLPRAR